MAVKLLIMKTDERGSTKLDGVPPRAPHLPGETVSIESSFNGPMAFVGLKLGPDDRIKTVTPHGVRRDSEDAVTTWRIDEIKIDDVAIEHASVLRVVAVVSGDEAMRGAFGVGSQVAMRATNVGATAGYFYATWELEDVH